MRSDILIPEKINVGFVHRDDTYTKKLAYIIYFDSKGVLRKEKSWDSWRDKEIENVIAENVPTSGFVLNKKAGGYSAGWNHRQTYVRVYDPRGFEFEINVQNLLYILENTSSIKGKGLEGEFVYAWDGKDLVLIPTSSPDYVELKKYNDIIQQKKKIKAKELVIGGTYLTKDNKEAIYMGRFEAFEQNYKNYKRMNDYGFYEGSVNTGKQHFFAVKNGGNVGFFHTKSMTKFIDVVSEECVDDYAELMDKLEYNTSYSPIDSSADEYIPYSVEELEKRLSSSSYHWLNRFYDENFKSIRLDYKEGKYSYQYDNPEYDRTKYWSRDKVPYYLTKEFENVQEIIEYFSPIYVKKYLVNGNLYEVEKN